MPGQHNSESPEEKLRRQQFYVILGDITRKDSEIASLKGEIGHLYDRAKKFHISKDVIKLAKKWSDMTDAEIQADIADIVFVAQAMKRSIGRQLSLLEEDHSPDSEKAYDQGYAAGAMGGENKNPWSTGSEQANEWQRGFADGNDFRNAKFAEAMADADVAEDDEDAGED